VRLPTRAAWSEWRDSLPPVPDYRDFYDHRGTKYAMRGALTSMQDGRCATCLRRPQHLVLDHEHFTGLARGMLCRGCNVLEGHLFVRDPAVFKMYRANPPAFGAGWLWDSSGYAGCVMFERARALGEHSISCTVDADLANMSYDVISAMVEKVRLAREAEAFRLMRSSTWGRPGFLVPPSPPFTAPALTTGRAVQDALF
jgi:hypothetical protein